MNRCLIKKIIILLFVGLVFCSCENFLDGGKLYNDLDSAIEYNNLPYTTVEIKANASSTNLVVPAIGYYSNKYKKSDSIALRFEAKEGYNFIKWTCEPENSVRFSDSKKTETTAIILNPVSKIVISPQTCLVPDAVVFPENQPSGVPQDTNIMVSFNTPLKAEYFYDSEKDSVKNIKIITGSTSWFPESDPYYYFNPPELSEDGKTLTISTNKSNLILTEEGTTKDLTVIVETKGLVSQENLQFEKNIEWTFRINSDLDKEKPTEVTASIFKDEKYETEVSAEVFSDSWEESKINLNHTGKNVYISARGYDAGGGIAGVLVKEKLIRTKEAVDVEGSSETVKTFYNNLKFEKKDNYYYSIKFQHGMKASSDGVVKVEISFLDYAGNESDSVVIYLVKDTELSSSLVHPLEDRNGAVNPAASGTVLDEGQISEYFKSPRYVKRAQEFIREADGKQDTVVFGFDDKIKENFYDSYKSGVSITKVLWGYEPDENLMQPALFDENTKKWSVKRDVSKNTYVRFYGKDVTENEVNTLRCIPQSVDPIGLSDFESTQIGDKVKKIVKTIDKTASEKIELNDALNNGVYTLFLFEDEINSPDKEFKVSYTYSQANLGGNSYHYDNSDCLFYFNPIARVNDKEVLCETTQKGSQVTATAEHYQEFLPYGNYYVYFVPFVKFEEGQYFGALSNPLIVTVKKSGSGEYNDCVAEEDEIESSVLPDDFKVEPVPGEKNSGVYKLKISFPEDFVKSENVNYYVKYNIKGSSKYIYSNSFEFNVESLKTYYVAICAKKINSEETVTTFKEIECTNDNVSPEFKAKPEILNGNFYSNCVKLFDKISSSASGVNFPTDSSGFDKNSEGKTELNYWFVKFSENQNSAADLREEDLISYKKHTVYCELDSDTEIILPYDYLEEGSYTLVVSAEDKNHNKSFMNVKTQIQIEEKYDYDIDYYVDNVDSKDCFCFDSWVNRSYFVMNIENFDNSEKSWNTYTNVYSNAGYKYFNHYVLSSNVNFESAVSKKIPLTDLGNKKSFVRINTMKLDCNKENVITYNNKYIYLDYISKAYTEAERDALYPCKKKGMLPSLSTVPAVMVMTDGPALVHTYCCSINLSGISDSDDDAVTWFTRGIEVTGKNAVMQEDGDFNYNLPLDSIEKGMWYTTIVHFADGTHLMTEPVQK